MCILRKGYLTINESEAVETIKQDADNCTRVKVSWLTARNRLANPSDELARLKRNLLGHGTVRRRNTRAANLMRTHIVGWHNTILTDAF